MMGSIKKEAGLEHDGGITRRDALKWAAGTGVAIMGMPAGNALAAASGTQVVSSSIRSASPTGTLRIANIGDPSTLDITRTQGEQDHLILWHQIYESLLGFDPHSSRLVGVLAESFTSSPDAREWTFKLKPGITFHDGEPLDSAAVKSTLAYYVGSPSYLKYLVPKDVTVDASDPTVARLTSRTPMPDLGRFMTSLFIVSPKLTAAGADAVGKHPTGTGPFQFVSYSPSVKLISEAFPNYRGPGPYFERLEYSLIADHDARVSALISGAVDLTKNVLPTAAQQLRQLHGITVADREVWAVAFLAIFTKTPPLNNVKLRRALAYAIDRRALVATIRLGEGKVIDSWSAPGVYGEVEPKSTYPYNPARAKQLIAESGVKKPIKISVVYIPEYGATIQQSAEAIANMATDAGFQATAVPVPAAKYNARATSGSVVKPWNAIPSGFGNPTGTIGFFTELGLEPLYMQYSDPVFQKLVQQVDTTPNGRKRLDLCAKLEDRVASQLPAIPLYTGYMIDAYTSKLHGYQITSFGSDPNLGVVHF